MSKIDTHVLPSGTLASIPAANAVAVHAIYYATDTGNLYQSDGSSTWTLMGPMTTRGDIAVAGASGVPQRLALGAADKSLVSNGTDLVYATDAAWRKTGANVIYGARGDGDPVRLAEWLGNIGGQVSPTNVTTSLARCVQFRLPRQLVVSHVWLYPINTTGVAAWVCSVYPVGVSTSKLWDSGTFDTTAATWHDAIGGGGSFTLAANTDYWFCVTVVDASSGTLIFRTCPGLTSAGITPFGADASPLGGGLGIGMPVLAQFAVTAGVFPGTLPTIAAAAWTTGTGVPIAFFQGTAS